VQLVETGGYMLQRVLHASQTGWTGIAAYLGGVVRWGLLVALGIYLPHTPWGSWTWALTVEVGLVLDAEVGRYAVDGLRSAGRTLGREALTVLLTITTLGCFWLT
jgi:hypothetical protein